MSHLRPSLSLLLGLAVLAGCAPLGMAPAPPALVRDGMLTLDAKRGTGRAIARLTVRDAAKRTLLAEVEENTASVIDHVDLSLVEWDGESEEGAELATGTMTGAQATTATITFTGLRTFRS